MASPLAGLRQYILDIVEDALIEALSPVAPYIRKLVGGALAIALSVFSFTLTLLASATALFLAFAGLPYALAAVWTGLIFLVLGLAFLGTGLGMMKKPKRRY